jgi:hypothetical protein
MQKDLGSERLKYLYNKYTEDNGEFDPYEASMIIGTAVHYAWKTYAGKLEETAVIYIFDSAHENETGGAIFLGKSNDKDCKGTYCYPGYPGDFSFKDTVNEWTVTKWALHGNTETKLCNQRTGLARGWGWGNKDCGDTDSNSQIDRDGLKCGQICPGYAPEGASPIEAVKGIWTEGMGIWETAYLLDNHLEWNGPEMTVGTDGTTYSVKIIYHASKDAGLKKMLPGNRALNDYIKINVTIA